MAGFCILLRLPENANKSSLLRIIVPLVVVLIGALVLASLSRPPAKDDNQQTPAEPDAPVAQVQADDADAQTDDAESDEPAQPVEPTIDPPTQVQAEPDAAETSSDDADAPAKATFENLRAAFPDTPAALDEPDDLITLGSLDPASDQDPGYRFAVRINPYRASIYDLTLADEFFNVDRKNHYTLLSPISYDLGSDNYPEAGTYAAKTLTVNGQPIRMARLDRDTDNWFGHWTVADQSREQVTLTLDLVAGPDDAPLPVATIVRTYAITPADQPGSYTVQLTQRVENLTDKPLTITWEQLAQGGIYHAPTDYLRGRSQQYVTGYFDLDYDPARFSLYVKNGFIAEPDLIGKLKDPADTGKWSTIWPNPQVDETQTKELAWLASENRYFVAISSAPAVDQAIDETADVTALQSIYPTITTDIYPNLAESPSTKDIDRRVVFSFISDTLTLAPGQASTDDQLSLDLFAGPREGAIFADQPYKALKYDLTIRYSLGGMCGFCTFQWLANLLLGFLQILHSVIFDWGVAIVILVLVVRLCLHPLTKRGQTNMMKMGKQMAAIQPEMDKLKKKYAEDPRQMQQAQMQLFREKGINPAAGALGCLPMFLQMPIWIALYAMLYYAIELRHEPAFYGIFQSFANWPFLADLSSADRFIPLLPDDGTHVLELIFIRLDYSSINILPILMGVTFYINMKFTTPPPMNEQQATQQKIMKIMPLLFPFFLYSAPAGLTLYIFASTLAGIVDSYIVRKHVKQMEDSGELFKPKQHKPGGFMDRLQKMAEVQAAKAEELKKQQAANRGAQPKGKKKRKR